MASRGHGPGVHEAIAQEVEYGEEVFHHLVQVEFEEGHAVGRVVHVEDQEAVVVNRQAHEHARVIRPGC